MSDLPPEKQQRMAELLEPALKELALEPGRWYKMTCDVHVVTEDHFRVRTVIQPHLNPHHNVSRETVVDMRDELPKQEQT